MKTFKQFLRYLFEATEEQKYNQYKQIPYDTYKKILLGDKIYDEDKLLFQKLGFNKVEDMVWSQIQPTKIDNNGYVQRVGHRAIWVLDLWKKDQFDPNVNDGHDLMEIYRSFYLYNIYKKKIREEPIFSHISDAGKIKSRSELMDINHFIEHNFLSKDNKKISDIGTDIEVVYEDTEWQILIPLTWRASLKYGRDIIKSNWCTASSNSSHYYNKYMSTNDLYIFYNKTSPEKSYQMGFHPNQEHPEFMNNKNSPVNLNEFKHENPGLKNTIDEILKEWHKIDENPSYKQQKILERFKRTRSPNIPYSMLEDPDNTNNRYIGWEMLDMLTPNELKSSFLVDEREEDTGVRDPGGNAILRMVKKWGNFLNVTVEHPELFIKILNLGADPNIQNRNGYTPIARASRNGDKELVQLLIQKGADVNIKTNSSSTPLHHASFGNHIEIVQLLLQNGAKVNIKNQDAQTPLYQASLNVTKDVISLLLDVISLLLKNGADPNIANNNGTLPLHNVCLYGNEDMAKLLLKYGANINEVNVNNETPLFMASLNKREHIISLLLKKGADPNIKNHMHISPLHHASRGADNPEIISLLLQYGANIEATTDKQETPLYWASEINRTDNISLLLQNGANPNVKNKYGDTPLYIASKDVYPVAVSILLQNGADPNLKTNADDTPLHWSSRSGNKEIVELLLKHGADPNTKNSQGETPLYFASNKGHNEIIELLKQYGAKE